MATITLTTHPATRAGLDVTANLTVVVTANTYQFLNDGRTKLHVVNATGSTCAVTAITPNTVDGNVIADKVVNVPNAKTYVLGPYPVGTYNNDAGYAQFTFDQTVSIIAVRD